ncbi:hypothetical protein WA026_019626 [Henosepilachna vigintioctopunctata]|uniref:Uncharacterized protein n=1 Tax=Henosepilachna vigintioctopunctata TaxID=420089 RepID=A0AAW1TPT9_9CUCU
MPHQVVYPSGDSYNPDHPNVNDTSQSYVREPNSNGGSPNVPPNRSSRNWQLYNIYTQHYYSKKQSVLQQDKIIVQTMCLGEWDFYEF